MYNFDGWAVTGTLRFFFRLVTAVFASAITVLFGTPLRVLEVDKFCFCAGVVELLDTLDLGYSGVVRGGKRHNRRKPFVLALLN